MTRKRYAKLRQSKMHPHTKFGIPTSKNIGDMHRTRSGTDGLTDGRTVRLLYDSQSSFGGIKIVYDQALIHFALIGDKSSKGAYEEAIRTSSQILSKLDLEINIGSIINIAQVLYTTSIIRQNCGRIFPYFWSKCVRTCVFAYM